MMSSICLMENSDVQMHDDRDSGLIARANDELAAAAGNWDENFKSHRRMHGNTVSYKIGREWIQVCKAGGVTEMDRICDISRTVCGYGDINQSIQSFESDDRTENFGTITSTRERFRDYLNVNASYSYRTHYYLKG